MTLTEEPWRTRDEDRPAASEPLSERWYQRRELHLLVGIAVAGLTVFFAGQRATAGARAQLDSRLVNAGAGADAALVDIESEQLSAVRGVTFTQGVAQALAAHDGPRLNTLVTPIQANTNVPMVDVVEPDGRVLLAVRTRGAPAPVASRKGLNALTLALKEAHGSRGGRLSEIVIYRSGPTLLTIGPILSKGKPVGAVLAMTPLADVLGRISQEVNAELTAYDSIGDPIATTATFNPKPVPPTTAQTLMAGGAIVTRYDHTDHREKLGRLIVDHEPDAVLGVALADDSSVVGRWVSIYVAIGLICAAIIFASFWARVVLAAKRYE
jgi:Double sensory domain of two-component sensor kinase